MTNGYCFDDCEFEFFDKYGKLAIAMNAVPPGFSRQQTTGNPAQILVSALPTLDVAAHSLHGGEGRLNQVGAAEGYRAV